MASALHHSHEIPSSPLLESQLKSRRHINACISVDFSQNPYDAASPPGSALGQIPRDVMYKASEDERGYGSVVVAEVMNTPCN